MVITKKELIEKICRLDSNMFEISLTMTQKGNSFSHITPDPRKPPTHILPQYDKDKYEMTITYKI